MKQKNKLVKKKLQTCEKRHKLVKKKSQTNEKENKKTQT